LKNTYSSCSRSQTLFPPHFLTPLLGRVHVNLKRADFRKSLLSKKGIYCRRRIAAPGKYNALKGKNRQNMPFMLRKFDIGVSVDFR
jgi:hypothetical protein